MNKKLAHRTILSLLTLGFLSISGINGCKYFDKIKEGNKADEKAKPTPTKPQLPPFDKTVYQVPVGSSPVKGKEDALVTIVEFSDFQCPFCSRVVPTIKKIKDKFGDQVRISFKHQPLPFHPNAEPASLASLAAHAQGKFWEMHDKLFEHQDKLDAATFEQYAKDLGLNLDKFKSDLSNPEIKAQIESDKTLASAIGANGTPTFFINGRPLRGAYPYEAFEALITEELEKANTLIKNGIAAKDVYQETTKNGLQKAPEPPRKNAPPAGRRKIEVSKEDPSEGGKTPKVTIVEFSDFECPFCSRVGPTIKELLSTYKDDIKIVFKQNPLSFHKHAELAAVAALAAHEQGKFWAMHDKLFENQKSLERADLEKYAKEIGLNLAKFKAALDDIKKYQERIQADQKLAASNGAGGTPAFFINGKLLSGAQPAANFKAVIDEEIKKADEFIKKGVKKEALYAEFMKEASDKPAAAEEEEPAGAPADVPVGSSAIKGNPQAPITIIEFSDFQCPFCSRANPALKEVMEKYPGKVKIAFKHYPLPFHKDAMLAAQAAEAAKMQGKFFEMHDKLFENQKELGREKLIDYAKQIGLDVSKFEKDMDSDAAKKQVEQDMKDAQKAGVDGTPSFFVNTKRLVGALPFEKFKTIIDEQLANKK